MGQELGVAIVGTGIMAKVHASALQGYHRSSVTGWLTRRQLDAVELDELVPAPVHRSMSELLEDPATGAVLIATPDHAHRDTAVAAIEAGRHVLVEKPLATTLEDAYAIRDAARAHGVVAMTLFNHRFVPSYWQAKQLSDQGALGPLRLAYARKNDTRFVPISLITWADQTTPSFFLSAHDVDLLLWYSDSTVTSVFASAVYGTLAGLGVNTPDAVQAQLRFANGALATVESCWIYPDTYPTMTDSFTELIFSEGVIQLDRKHEQLELANATKFTYPRNSLVNQVGGKPGGSTVSAVQHFVDCVLDDKEPLIDIASSVHVTEVLVAIQESCTTGVPVSLTKEQS